jgi:hypothetical protein
MKIAWDFGSGLEFTHSPDEVKLPENVPGRIRIKVYDVRI